MTLQESNKLIADFMGVSKCTDPEHQEDPCYYFKDCYQTADSAKYSISWDWLMPVVEKIESLDLRERFYQWEEIKGLKCYNFEGISVEIENNRCWIYAHMALDPWFTFNNESHAITYPTKIEAVYKAVVEFVRWYNLRP